MSKVKKRTLSLFSGCGGMDLGFEGDFEVLSNTINKKINPSWIRKVKGNWCRLKPTIFETVFANDLKVPARNAWYNYFRKRGRQSALYRVDSIIDLVKFHSRTSDIFPDRVDVVTGGFPCQDFSIAGKRQGFGSLKYHNNATLSNPSIESRGMLYIWMREVIKITNPKIFIAENVKGLMSLENVQEVIENDFSNIGQGFIVVPARVLHAAEYGIPQNRQRVLFIGFNKEFLSAKAKLKLSLDHIDENISPYPRKTHCINIDSISNGLLPAVSCRSAFIDLKEPENEMNDLSQMSYSKSKWYGAHCQGQTEIKLDQIGPTIRAEHHGNIEFRRLDISKGGNYKDEFQSGKKERRLTVRECARIQTFPDDFDFVLKGETKVSITDGYKLIGNAVPPLLAYHLAKRIETLWDYYFDEQK